MNDSQPDYNGGFDEKMLAASNGEPAILSGGHYYFANSACREARNPGALYYPPNDPKELLRLKIFYFKLAYEFHLKEFDQTKQEMLETAKNPFYAPMPHEVEQAKQHLKKLRDNVRVAKKKLDDVSASTTEAERIERQRAAETRELLVERQKAYKNALNGIEV